MGVVYFLTVHIAFSIFFFRKAFCFVKDNLMLSMEEGTHGYLISYSKRSVCVKFCWYLLSDFSHPFPVLRKKLSWLMHINVCCLWHLFSLDENLWRCSCLIIKIKLFFFLILLHHVLGNHSSTSVKNYIIFK